MSIRAPSPSVMSRSARTLNLPLGKAMALSSVTLSATRYNDPPMAAAPTACPHQTGAVRRRP